MRRRFLFASITVGLVVSSMAAAPSSGAGRVVEARVPSRIYPAGRRVLVYTPPAYDPNRSGGYRLLVGFDADEYVDEIPLPKILDGLAATSDTQFVAILVDDGSGAQRTGELGNNRRFADFVAGELLDWTRAHYAVTRDPHRTIITGSSAGGIGAAYAALLHPDRFGSVISQSGAFWRGLEGSNDAPYEWLTSHVAGSRRVDVRFVLEVGALETHGALGGAAPSILDANRHLRDALLAKGYPVTYREVPGGQHRPEDWKKGLGAWIAMMAK